MKAPPILLLSLAFFALTGCGSNNVETAAPESDQASLFTKGRGVLLTGETKNLFGIEMAEVIEKPMQRRFERTAQVYRSAHDGLPARAMLLLSGEEAKGLKAGQAVKLQTRDAADHHGTLVRLDPQAQAVLGQIEVLVEFTDTHQHCSSGGFVTVTFTEDDAKAMFVVPESALLTTADGSYVYTVNGEHLTRTRVKPGVASEGFVAIEDGLYAGDSIVTKGTGNLWLVELSALKGGTPCCPVPKKNAEK